MPIESPQLDDLRFSRLVEELRLRIPVYTPEWTDHNDSDPGMTLIQLFAHLAELTGYRLNRIPEKNHVELLKLLGVRLKPAQAAGTQLAFLLADPKTLDGFTLTQGSRVSASVGDPPPTFETDRDVDVVPAEPVVLLTTEKPDLWNLPDGDEPPEDPSANDFLTVVWDGKKPKLKDMPLAPIELAPNSSQRHLWIGVALNPSPGAGFLGVRVTLTFQLDDDERPDLTAAQLCERKRLAGESPPTIDWLYYYDTAKELMRRVPGRIDDSTNQLTQSGCLTFLVPQDLGPIPESMFANLREAREPSNLAGCKALGGALERGIRELHPEDAKIDLATLQTALTEAMDSISPEDSESTPAVPHPLDPKLRDPAKVRGWFRLTLPDSFQASTGPRLRIFTFNAAAASHASTVTNELLGTTTGRAGLQVQLANGNVLGDVELAIQEDVGGLMVPWKQVDGLDPTGPNDRVFDLDAEAGIIRFGDGIRGRIPPLVPGGGNIVATRYRHGGGRSGEVDVGTITSLEAAHAGLVAAVNYVAARGGHDAETLDDAKQRARRELATRHRAVTAGDFQFIAEQTPGVRVARVHVVPLRRPLPGDGPVEPVGTAFCGGPPPDVPAGLEDDLTAHGAVSVVVVPDLPDPDHPEPVPTPSFLRAVCCHLDRHRLVTTEVHVVPPQYARLCRFNVEVRAEPGYSRTQLQTLVERRLATYLHVLRGGEDGRGFPFGGQVHVADLMAQIFRTEGIDRVESLTAEFTRTKSNAVPRQGRLVLCGDTEYINLAPEENVSVDLSDFTLTTVV